MVFVCEKSYNGWMMMCPAAVLLKYLKILDFEVEQPHRSKCRTPSGPIV